MESGMGKKILHYFLISMALIILFYFLNFIQGHLMRLKIEKGLDFKEIEYKSDKLLQMQKLLSYNNIKLNIIGQIKDTDKGAKINRDFLRRLTLYLPANVYLRKLNVNYRKGYILIAGTAIRKDTLARFVKNIKSDEIVSYIKIDALNRRIYKKSQFIGYDFNIFVKTL